MVEQGAGAVLNVASTAAFQPLPGFATYAASKAFVHSFSEAVHSELRGTGVSVTSLCPGFTRTEFEQAAGAEDAAAKLPGFTWMESDDVARQAIEGMLAGKRTVVPGALNKAVSTSGRYIPRTVLLPLVKTVSKNSLGRPSPRSAARRPRGRRRRPCPPSSRRESCARRKYSGASCSHVAPMPPWTEICARDAWSSAWPATSRNADAASGNSSGLSWPAQPA